MPPKKDFHACTIKYEGRTDRIITELLIYPPFDPFNPPSPLPPFQKVSALWDTGATRSVITEATAKSLGLTPTGVALVDHAGGGSTENTYVVNFGLPNGVGIPGVQVTGASSIQATDFSAIIGMDIITSGDFAVTNVDDKTCMTFRLPSISVLDYVLEANRIKYGKVAKNAPCPCGKKDKDGKPIKFKLCCEKSLGLA